MKTLIFGTGAIASAIISKVKEEYEIVGFLDNSIKKQNTFFDVEKEYYIYSPSEIAKLEFDKIIIASTNYASEMFSQLLELGVREHDIIVDYVCGFANIYLFDFLKMQMNQYDEFNRMDIIVKYMAIASYYNGDTKGIELYIKMQQLRLNISKTDAMRQWEKFRNLIESIEINGYDDKSYVVCDENLKIMDGAHRVAICLYMGISQIPVKITPQKFECRYEMAWFWEKNFLREEINNIENVRKFINKTENEEIIAIIWPPARAYVEEIKRDLACLTEIKFSETVMFETRDEFQHFVRAVYSVDDIEQWKVEKKIENMLEENSVEVLTLHMAKPNYRLKAGTRMPISVMVERIKRILRNRYKDKIDGYYYDNIIHVADNYYQSQLMKKIITLDCNLTQLFDSMRDRRYALSKMEVQYMPVDFPCKYPIHKDADILCLKESFEDIVMCCKKFSKEYAMRYDMQTVEISEENRKRIRIEYMGFLIYQFDISNEIENLKYKFVEEAVKRRVEKNGYFVLSEKDEIIVRLNEVEMHPEKKDHKQYLLKRNIENNNLLLEPYKSVNNMKGGKDNG